MRIADFPKTVVIIDSSKGERIAIGDHFELECAGDAIEITKHIAWKRHRQYIKNTTKLTIEDTTTKYSRRRKIVWDKIEKADEGMYDCEANSKKNKKDRTISTYSFSLKLHEPETIEIYANFNETVLKRASGESLYLECRLTGLPVPRLVWFKDDEIFAINETILDEVQRVSNTNIGLKFAALQYGDTGTYRCEASNRIESKFQIVRLDVKGESFRLAFMWFPLRQLS